MTCTLDTEQAAKHLLCNYRGDIIDRRVMTPSEAERLNAERREKISKWNSTREAWQAPRVAPVWVANE